MIKIRWLESFETGVKVVDDDHRLLVSLMEDLQNAVTEKDDDRFDDRFARFLKAAKAHFVREEAVLVKADYPRITEHCKIHKQLIAKGESARKFCAATPDRDEINACVEELAVMLIGDIVEADVNFKSFLQEAQVH